MGWWLNKESCVADAEEWEASMVDEVTEVMGLVRHEFQGL